MIIETQSQEVLETLDLGDIESGQGLNQEMGLGRPGDTRWGSHYNIVANVTSLYSTIVKVLEKIGANNIYKEDRVKAITIMDTFESFEFIFMIHLMFEIFGITDKLCQALQRRDQDIVNAMSFVTLTKERLQKMREHGWDDFLDLVTCFCVQHNIDVPSMSDLYVPRGRSKRFFAKGQNLHRFRIEMIFSVIDLQLQELNNRFDEANMELLICMKRLMRLAEFYPKEFPSNDMTMTALRHEFEFFIDDMRKDESINPSGGNCNCGKMFSSMTYVKNKLRNSMGDQLMNDCLVIFLERDLFANVSDNDVLKRFQSMKTRRMLL
ncbi:uncharacterized protein LOC110689641 [Chenopodium quinoa]|uniref:uncharacterized protein LOC110689641 n=1 Tax=Chenopodium quinoa TaxID=63459 RepID=UPI000B78B20C|nr:uncharacterized protein LOC110689641 [Chenopodium quinoa]